MLGKKPNWYWKSMWLFVTPTLTLVIIFASFYSLAANGIKYIRWDPETVSKGNLYFKLRDQNPKF